VGTDAQASNPLEQTLNCKRHGCRQAPAGVQLAVTIDKVMVLRIGLSKPESNKKRRLPEEPPFPLEVVPAFPLTHSAYQGLVKSPNS